MTPRCDNPACSFNDGGPCALAASLDDGMACPHLGAVPAATMAEPAPREPYVGRFWSGAAFGRDDAWAALWGRDPRLIVVAGEEEVGKTALLVSMWVELANGHAAQEWRVAGSKTLFGWHSLSQAAFGWSRTGMPMVPRTNLADVRQPGFLELELTRDLGHHITTVLLTDFPGEWFETLIHQPALAALQLPVFRRADGLIVVVDLPRLGSSKDYVEETSLLIERFADIAPGVPLAIVWSKCDELDLPPGPAADQAFGDARLRRRVDQLCHLAGRAFRRQMGFATSACVPSRAEFAPRRTLDPLLWLLSASSPAAGDPPWEAPRPQRGDPFLWMRERRRVG